MAPRLGFSSQHLSCDIERPPYRSPGRRLLNSFRALVWGAALWGIANQPPGIASFPNGCVSLWMHARLLSLGLLNLRLQLRNHLLLALLLLHLLKLSTTLLDRLSHRLGNIHLSHPLER